MGDVKRSGKTFEERKALSIARQKVEAEHETTIRAERRAVETPEQKLKKNHAMMDLMMMLAMTGAYQSPFKHR